VTRDRPCTSCLGHGRIGYVSDRDATIGLWNQPRQLTRDSTWLDSAEVRSWFRTCPSCDGRGVISGVKS